MFKKDQNGVHVSRRVDGTVAHPTVKAYIVLWPKPVGEPPCLPPEMGGILELDVPEAVCNFREVPEEPPPEDPPRSGG